MLANKVSQTYNPPLSSTHCKERSTSWPKLSPAQSNFAARSFRHTPFLLRQISRIPSARNRAAFHHSAQQWPSEKTGDVLCARKKV